MPQGKKDPTGTGLYLWTVREGLEDFCPACQQIRRTYCEIVDGEGRICCCHCQKILATVNQWMKHPATVRRLNEKNIFDKQEAGYTMVNMRKKLEKQSERITAVEISGDCESWEEPKSMDTWGNVGKGLAHILDMILSGERVFLRAKYVDIYSNGTNGLPKTGGTFELGVTMLEPPIRLIQAGAPAPPAVTPGKPIEHSDVSSGPAGGELKQDAS